MAPKSAPAGSKRKSAPTGGGGGGQPAAKKGKAEADTKGQGNEEEEEKTVKPAAAATAASAVASTDNNSDEPADEPPATDEPSSPPLANDRRLVCTAKHDLCKLPDEDQEWPHISTEHNRHTNCPIYRAIVWKMVGVFLSFDSRAIFQTARAADKEMENLGDPSELYDDMTTSVRTTSDALKGQGLWVPQEDTPGSDESDGDAAKEKEKG